MNVFLGDDILATEFEKKKTSWLNRALSGSSSGQSSEKAVEKEPETLPQHDPEPVPNSQFQQPEEQQPEPVRYEEQPAPTPTVEQNLVVNDIQLIFNRENQDKTALDVITSIENLLKDRQLIALKIQALTEQITNANEQIQRLKRESVKKDQLIQEKTKEIRELEINLTNNQMSYDQLLEDYKEYQLNSNLDFEKLTNQLETEKSKYNKLFEESNRANAQNASIITELRERIRNLEIENMRFAEQYEKISNEKAELMKTINDFTEKMSFSFNFKNNN